jgi:hypothetical protein
MSVSEARRAARALVLSGSLGGRIDRLEALLTPDHGGHHPLDDPSPRVRGILRAARAMDAAARVSEKPLDYLRAVELFAEAEDVFRANAAPIRVARRRSEWAALREKETAQLVALASQRVRGSDAMRAKGEKNAEQIISEYQKLREENPALSHPAIIGWLTRNLKLSRRTIVRRLNAAGLK